jgi:hypothetical protein
MNNVFKIKINYEGMKVHSIKAQSEAEAEKKLKGFFGKFR